MPAAQESFQKAVQDILEVVMFENWLRFYFIPTDSENPGVPLNLKLPTKSLDRIRELYPALYPLAERLNNKPIDFETSRNSVLEHILQNMEGKTLEKGLAQQVLQSQTFQIRLQLFHTWEQMHEDQLDYNFMEFGSWRNLFAQWLETPGAKELAKKLLQTG